MGSLSSCLENGSPPSNHCCHVYPPPSARGSAPRSAGEAATLPYTIAPPAHPTYSIADAIKLALEEDIADVGDISSLST